MKLRDLERFNQIVIQMHDNPDADAVGSGYAMYRYFKDKGKKVRLVYGGRNKIKKSNMMLLIEELNIPVEYISSLEKPELLLIVDAQYGQGNVQQFEAHNVAMIDHHNTGKESGDMCEIRSNIVSCATICYDLLEKEGYDVNNDITVATALYYGLYMDSKEFSEIHHPLERDMMDDLQIDKRLFKRLTHANFTLSEMETAGMAMLRYNFDEKKRVSVIHSKPCDPNILGIIGDFVLQVDSIDVSVIYNECPGGYKLSVRSCVADVAANELAIFLTTDIGSGGGHLDKAGGFINGDLYEKKYDDKSVDAYLYGRIEEYYDSYEVINARDGIEDDGDFEEYRKIPFICGFLKSTDVFPEGTLCRIRTLEGDVNIQADEDTFLIIGYYGEVYPITREVFAKKYKILDEIYEKHFEYEPSVKNVNEDKTIRLMPFIKSCISTGEAVIKVKKLDKPVKVFTKWDYETYMYGDKNDYICYNIEDETDVYIIKNEVFLQTYAKK